MVPIAEKTMSLSMGDTYQKAVFDSTQVSQDLRWSIQADNLMRDSFTFFSQILNELSSLEWLLARCWAMTTKMDGYSNKLCQEYSSIAVWVWMTAQTIWVAMSLGCIMSWLSWLGTHSMWTSSKICWTLRQVNSHASFFIQHLRCQNYNCIG